LLSTVVVVVVVVKDIEAGRVEPQNDILARTFKDVTEST
jgi:hypothetical protein